jgi:hypothetical protein
MGVVDASKTALIIAGEGAAPSGNTAFIIMYARTSAAAPATTGVA